MKINQDNQFDEQDTPEQSTKLQNIVNEQLVLHHNYTQEDILNIYVFGSRLYGSASADSDYDIMAIIRDDSFDRLVFRKTESTPTLSKDANLRKTGFLQSIVDGIKIDVTTYSKSYFVQKMNLYNIYEMSAIWIPNKFKLQEKFNLIDEWADKDSDGIPEIRIGSLRNKISTQCQDVWKMSKKWFHDAVKDGNIKTEDLYKAKKGFVASLRIYKFATQIALQGKIVDWACASEYSSHPWVKDQNMICFDEFYSHFNTIKIKLHEQFRVAAPK
ncbi:ERAD-associated E3 ubiquitin-protein ligase [Acrasis kona]|uniref:ERAD-associated E3 ubiquitin-protein ligase n=1 Tax=Acrasis kona TaxID=1008807 RepID=A0AAW2YQK6_9EUKA